ncbi:MAG TPA: carboxypeptidase-like regulatory domain-containing protein [Nannocystis sp.]
MRPHPAPPPASTAPCRVRSAVTASPTVWCLAALLTLVTGCSTGARSNGHYRYPREAAYGRPSTCPDVRLPPLRDGGVSPDAARCSYADANGAKVTHLAGKVLAEGGPGDPGTAVPEVAVTIHPVAGPVFDVDAPGPSIAHATTDAQGNYSLRGVFVAGDYAIVVREPTGERITERVVRVEPNAVGSIRDLRVMVPIDPRLRAEAAGLPPASADPRLHAPAAKVPAPVATSASTTPASTAPASTTPATSSPPTTPPTTPPTPRPKPSPGLRMRPPTP